jgi:transposase
MDKTTRYVGLTTRYVGLDVHGDTIAAAVAEGRGMVRTLGIFPNRPESVRKFIEQLDRGGDLKVCYEAGPTGYALYWQLTKMGVDCEVVAPSLIPRKPGEKIKTDRRDAEKLAQCYQSGTLTPVWVPDAAHEALRDLVRARATAKGDESRAKHRLVNYLLRYGLRHPDGSRAWTHPWWRRVQSREFAFETQKETLGDYIAEVVRQGERLSRLDAAIDRAIAAAPPEKRAVVEALQALRGVAKLTAVTIVTEVGTFRRFRKPTELMGYTGLVPSEHSSGSREAKGRITRTGNSHLRHVLGEAAWHARHRPWLNVRLKKVLSTLPPGVSEIAWRAQERLHRKFTKLTYHRKPAGKVATAVARELVGFIWAIGRLAEDNAAAAAAAAAA